MLTNLTISYPDFKISEVIEPDHFDTNNADIKKKIDAIIAVLNQLTDATTNGASGADAISLTAIAPYTSTKLQAFLTEVITKLKSTGGSAEIGTPSIAGVTGTTVSAQLASLKSLLDGHATRLTTAEGKISSLETRATNVEGRATTLENRATSLETRATNLENNKTDKTTTTALTTRVSAVETGKTDNATTTALDGRVGTLESGKADKSTTYTRTDVDSKLSTKTDKTGDHRGTWFGLTPGQAAEPINGARLDVLEAQNVQQVTLTNGVNTIANVVQEAPLKVLSTGGKTVVNYAPKFAAWIKSPNLTVNSDFKATLTVSDGTRKSSSVSIATAPGKTYTLSGIITGGSPGRIFIDFYTSNRTYISTVRLGTFTTPPNTATMELGVDNWGDGTTLGNGTFTFENISLVEGSVTLPCVDSVKGIVNPTIESNGKREVVETTLHALNGVQDELFRDMDGKLKKRVWFKEIMLDGSLNWSYSNDYSGYKRVLAPHGLSYVPSMREGSKYDGKILLNGLVGATYTSTSDGFTMHSDGNYYVTIADTDSGWGETYTPTSDEVKAYFYGWKMSQQEGGISTPYNGTGTKWWFRTTESGNAVSGSGQAVLPTFQSADRPAYKIIYQLATERIEDVSSSGQVVLEEGSNTVELKQGVIVKERVSVIGQYNSTYYINSKNAGTLSKLKYPLFKIIAVYKNNQLLTFGSSGSGDYSVSGEYHENAYGKHYIFMDSAQYDPTATYYVSYEVMPELTVKANPMQVEYTSSLKSLVESNTRQIAEHEGRLDGLHTTYAKKVQENWFPIVLQNGATNAGNSFTASCMKDEFGFVHVRGFIKCPTTTAGLVIGTIPFKPIRNISFACVSASVADTTGAYPCTMDINTGGQICLGRNVKDSWVQMNFTFMEV